MPKPIYSIQERQQENKEGQGHSLCFCSPASTKREKRGVNIKLEGERGKKEEEMNKSIA